MKYVSIVYERFSLISKKQEFWSRISKQMDFESYKKKILDPVRLAERTDIFLNYQLPLLAMAAQKYNLLVYVMTSKLLPDDLSRRLKEEAARYPFLHIDFFDEETEPNLRKTLINYLGRYDPEEVMCSISRLDDDDLLHPRFFDNMRKYMRKEFLDFGISHTRGHVGLYMNGRYVKFAPRRQFNTSQGLGVISLYHKGNFLSKYCYPPGSHTALDVRIPVIGDGTINGYIYTINGYNDSWRLVAGMDDAAVDNYFFKKEEKFETIDKLYYNRFSQAMKNSN